LKEKKYVLPPPETITISAEAANKLIDSANPAAALLYLYILKNGGTLSSEQAAAELKLGDGIYPAMAELKKLGLIASEPKTITEREDTPPEYTAEDIERSVESGSSFRPLIEELQHMLGKILSGNELKIFYGIYDYLGLPAEVIVLLVNHCIEKQAARYGEGRKPTVRMIEREAYAWARREIFSLEMAEEYLKHLAKISDMTEKVKEVLRIGNRALSPTEEKYIASWLEMGFDADALEIAYDRTVIKTGELTWAYMNSIVKSWNSKGLRTAADILSNDSRTPGQRKKSADRQPDKTELERMKKYLKSLKESN
jgi:DnaD/phage-associated family protein